MNNKRLSHIYWDMRDRCYNPNRSNYKRYGGRGITVCDEWMNTECYFGKSTKGWITFRDWALNNGYNDNLTIDRIDVNEGYSPDNCRWVSLKAQANNTRRNHLVTYKGKTQTLAQWCDELGLEYGTAQSRIHKLHWTIERTFETKENPNCKMIAYKGETKSLMSWCKELGLNYRLTQDRLNKLHWSVEQAFETKENVVYKLITYKGKIQHLASWCRELDLDYAKTLYRLNKQHWSIAKAFNSPCGITE